MTEELEIAREQARVDQHWKELEACRPSIARIAQHGVDSSEADLTLVGMVCNLVARELILRLLKRTAPND